MTGAGFKRGTDFGALVTMTSIKDALGADVTDLTGWTAQSQLRGSDGSLIATLTATIVDPTGHKVRLNASSTGDWPTGLARFDVVLISPTGAKVPSETFEFSIIKGPTEVAP